MSANKIQLTKNDESVLFTFTDSKHYLTGNGRIEVPLNSLSLVIDSSDMVTFRKAASNDIFVSAPISDFGMSKADLEDWYAENMVGGTGGGIDPETLAELVSSAEYVSSSSTIDFKNVDGEVISTINAEPFITDGMVDNVQISGTNLVITFNVDAGKQPISIPLSSIFNPENYYDKSATDTLLNGKADTSAVTVDEYSIYATRDNIISTAYTSTPITWVKITPKGNLGKSGSLQFSGVTGYLYIQNIDYVNGTYTVGSGSLDPSLVSGLSITFEDGAMIVEVDASNPITTASFSNTVIEYVKTVIPEKVVSDAVYDNLYPLIGKVDNSLKSVTVNSASTVQQEIGIRQTKNDGGSTNQIVSLGGYLSYSGTTLKAEAYVNTGTNTLTTVAPTINSSSRTDYYFTDNVGQTAEANHIEIQILTGDTVTLYFYGYDNRGVQASRSLVISGGTVTSGYGWPSEAIYSFSNGVLTVDYAYTGTSIGNPITIDRILANVQYGSTASVSDIVGYVKALLKDKVEVTEYIENTLKPTIDDIEDSEEVIAQSINVLSASLSGKQDTLVAGSGITISGNVISANGGGGVDPSILDGKVDKNSIAPLEGISISGECPNEIDGTTGVTKITYSPFTEQYHSIRETDNGVEYTYDFPIMGKVDFYDENGELLHTIEGIENWDSVPYIERWGNEIVSGDTIVNSETYLTLDASPNGNAETQQGEISLGINSVGASSNISIFATNGEETHRNGVEINAQDGVSSTSLKVTPSGVTINDEEVATVSMLDEKVDIIDYDEAQRVTAAALNDLNDRFGGLKLRKLTQVQYDALTVKDDNTLYIITNVVNNNA